MATSVCSSYGAPGHRDVNYDGNGVYNYSADCRYQRTLVTIPTDVHPRYRRHTDVCRQRTPAVNHSNQTSAENGSLNVPVQQTADCAYKREYANHLLRSSFITLPSVTGFDKNETYEVIIRILHQTSHLTRSTNKWHSRTDDHDHCRKTNLFFAKAERDGERQHTANYTKQLSQKQITSEVLAKKTCRHFLAVTTRNCRPMPFIAGAGEAGASRRPPGLPRPSRWPATPAETSSIYQFI
ncbi:hypothetical protein WI665_03335 [Vibrio cholerae]